MVLPPRIRLSEAEKDALLLEQAALIERLAARIAALEAAIGKPQKTSSNSHLPPSKDGPGRGDRPKRPRRKRPSRSGKSRPLTETPDKTERRMASECGHCGMDVSGGSSAVANAFRRAGAGLVAASEAIKRKLVTARIVESDETTTRVDGVTHWQWVFISDKAVLHEIAPRRAKSAAEDVLAGHRPDVWVSDRYTGDCQEFRVWPGG